MNITLPSADAEQIAGALAASSSAITVLVATVAKLPSGVSRQLREAARQADVAGALLATHRPAEAPATAVDVKQAAHAATGKRGAPRDGSARRR